MDDFLHKLQSSFLMLASYSFSSTYAAGGHRQAVVTLKKYIADLDRLWATKFSTLLHPSLGFDPYFGNQIN